MDINLRAFKDFKELDIVSLWKLFQNSQLLAGIAKRTLAFEIEYVNHLLRDVIEPYDGRPFAERLPKGEQGRNALLNSWKSIVKEYATKEDMRMGCFRDLEAGSRDLSWGLFCNVRTLLHRQQSVLEYLKDLFVRHKLPQGNSYNWTEAANDFANEDIINNLPTGEYYIDPFNYCLYRRKDIFDLV